MNFRWKHFSCCYTETAPNFSLSESASVDAAGRLKTFQVLESLLHRGNPSPPSVETLARIEHSACTIPSAVENSTAVRSIPDWTQTIKGAANGYNPALEFFD